MRKKKIKTIDLGSRQLSLDFEPSEEKDKAAILAYMNGPGAEELPIPFDDLVARFTAKPYELNSMRVAQLTLELAADYKLGVEKSGEKLHPLSAKKVLASSSRWKNTHIIREVVASPDELKAAADLCGELFGYEGGDGQNELCRFLRKRLRRWKNELSSFRRAADRGPYPGKKKIDAGLALIQLLLAVDEPHVFIRTSIENGSELSRLGADVAALTDFHKNGLETWSALLKSLDEFEPNREELEKDPDAGKALDELREISRAPEPYDRLGEVEALIAAAAGKNREIVENKLDAARKTALEDVENRITEATRLLDEKKATPDRKNRALFRLQKIRKRLLAADDASQVEDCLDKAEEAYDMAMEFIVKLQRPGGVILDEG